jgi:hypothetical protein
MLKKIFAQLGIINWKTTMTGISGLILTGGTILNAWRTKDFQTIFTQSQTLIPIILGLILSLQGLAAKDSTVTGIGTQAATLDDKGQLKNVDNVTVGTQPVEK